MFTDSRAQELQNLKLALSTFALQLDNFETRLKNLSSKTPAPVAQVTASDTEFAHKIVAAMKSADRNAP